MEQRIPQNLLAFLDASPSCYHAANNVMKELQAAGYQRLWESEHWKLEVGGKYFVSRGDASVIAFRIQKQDFCGFMISASHSDSPTFKVRETAEIASAGNCLRLSVEPYGGMVMRSWMDRPLSVAGRVLVREKGQIVTKLVNIDRDLLVIPSVAIHMDREVNKGKEVKANVDLLPLFGTGKEPGAIHGFVPVFQNQSLSDRCGRRICVRRPSGRFAVCLWLPVGLPDGGRKRKHAGAGGVPQ